MKNTLAYTASTLSGLSTDLSNLVNAAHKEFEFLYVFAAKMEHALQRLL